MLLGDVMNSVLKTVALAAAAIMLTGCATVSAPAPLAQGDWVLARWQDDREWYFPAVVTTRTGDELALQYDDGDSGTQPAENVRPFDWNVGTQLSCLERRAMVSRAHHADEREPLRHRCARREYAFGCFLWHHRPQETRGEIVA
jgi:hypothetical protein